MGKSWTLCVSAVCFVLCLSSTTLAQVVAENCSSVASCGWMATCENSVCSCSQPLVLHDNGKDCRNDSCTGTDCLQCDVPDTCIKCASFITKPSGVCLKKCEGSAELQGEDLVCTVDEDDDDDKETIIIAVVAGVAAGAVLCVIVIVAVCVYIRKTRRNVDLQNKSYGDRQMETGHVKQYPMYENNAFETDSQSGYRPGKIDPLEYVSELDKLRPHSDTLMALLSQTRAKTRAMNSSDPRIPTYKGVIHQLCRVLGLLHKTDPVVSIPSDALGLLQWAHQMLEDHREQQLSTSGSTSDIPVAQISPVDFDLDNPGGPVYATPDGSQGQMSTSSFTQGVANPYSTVAVPSTHRKQGQPVYSGGKRPGFATISRARSIPNGALISALEAEGNMNTFPKPQVHTSASNDQPGNGFRLEDFQNFLINNGEKSDVRSAYDRQVEANPNPPGLEPLSVNDLKSFTEKNSAIHDKNFKDHLNSTHSLKKNSFAQNSNTFQPKAESHDQGISNQPSLKKNIITNPNAIKKSNSVTGKHKYAVPNIGYFANGRYYDPNPMPDTSGEVYAPGSSYSGQSNVMSTFLGDLPRSQSSTSSNLSEDVDGYSENSGGELDVFPFDPNDATEPVEV